MKKIVIPALIAVLTLYGTAGAGLLDKAKQYLDKDKPKTSDLPRLPGRPRGAGGARMTRRPWPTA